MSKSKINRGSQVIVDPLELTEFLRSSRDLSELDEENLTVAHKQENGELSPEFRSIKQRPDTFLGNSVPKKKAKTGWRRFVGIACALATGICFTVANIIVKSLKHHDPINLSFWRYFGLIIPTVPYLLGMKIFKNVNLWATIGMSDEPVRFCGCCTVPVRSKNMFNFFVMSALGIPIFILRYASLKYLSIADSTVIVYSGPLFTIVFGHFFLKEKCGFVTIPISIFTLLGVVVVSRPTFLTGKQEMDNSILIGIGLSLISTLILSIFFIMTRQLRHVHFMVINCASGIMGLVIAGTAVWTVGVLKVPEGILDALLILALGLLSFLGGCFITAALKFEDAGTVSVVRMVDVFYSFLFEFAWFGLVPDIYSIAGALIVITGVLLITFRKILSTLSEDHCLRRAFCFLLY